MSINFTDQPPPERLLTYHDAGILVRLDTHQVRRTWDEQDLPKWKLHRGGRDHVAIDLHDVERVFAKRLEDLGALEPARAVPSVGLGEAGSAAHPGDAPLQRLGGNYAALMMAARFLRLFANLALVVMFVISATMMSKAETFMEYATPWMLTIGTYFTLLMIAEAACWAVDVVKALWAIEEHQRAARERPRSSVLSSPGDVRDPS